MLQESEGSGRLVFNAQRICERSGADLARSSFPTYGKVLTRITTVRKLVTNYETYVAYEIETVVSSRLHFNYFNAV